MRKKHGWWEKGKQLRGNWTKDAWFAYRDWAERWGRTQINWYRIKLAVADAESRED